MQVDGGYGISWNDELDLSADEIWDHGTSTGRQQDVDIKLMVGYKLTEARCEQGMTQKELAEGMGMKVEVEFVD